MIKALFSCLLLFSLASAIAEEEWRPLFNGKDLTGWDGDPALWKVEEGIIIGTCTGPESPKHNSFLIWTEGTVKDFELKATVRVIGDNNSGIQYRSRKIPEFGEWAISGYQCDIHPAIQHTGMTYEEKGRGIFGLNGTHVLLDQEGERWKTAESEPVEADTSEWTEYTVIARGNHLIHQVNGETTSELIDHHEEGRSLEGLVAIQLHRGNPNRVEIKEIKIRELKDGKIFSFEIPEGAEKIERPRTSNPQGTGPIQKGKTNDVRDPLPKSNPAPLRLESDLGSSKGAVEMYKSLSQERRKKLLELMSASIKENPDLTRAEIGELLRSYVERFVGLEESPEKQTIIE